VGISDVVVTLNSRCEVLVAGQWPRQRGVFSQFVRSFQRFITHLIIVGNASRVTARPV